ncbi:MAG: hypothetical protein C4519_17980 [Desulfobacteraceae bacterium]|nr:MAG: hypothetical protein C4519_17980 [Desulfobacteraceae bacterium]
MPRLLTSIVLLLWVVPVGASAGQLAYYSDYFSFVGRDAQGFVAFALDNNRGVDGSDYQAEHFGVLYEQHSGWFDLAGTGEYENAQGMLARIPDSAYFKFEGHPESGLTIRSVANSLALSIAPMVIHLHSAGQNRTQDWGAAQAMLHWQGRQIPGRVIYEALIYSEWNRLTRTYLDAWDNFQGFYLALAKGTPDKWQDFYLRSTGDGGHHRGKGFTTADDWRGTVYSTRLEASDMALNFGFFRWPQRWTVQAVLEGAENPAPVTLRLRQISRRNQRNWIIGGFAMTVVEGELLGNGEVIPVLGLVELIK